MYKPFELQHYYLCFRKTHQNPITYPEFWIFETREVVFKLKWENKLASDLQIKTLLKIPMDCPLGMQNQRHFHPPLQHQCAFSPLLQPSFQEACNTEFKSAHSLSVLEQLNLVTNTPIISFPQK